MMRSENRNKTKISSFENEVTRPGVFMTTIGLCYSQQVIIHASEILTRLDKKICRAVFEIILKVCENVLATFQ